MEYYRLVPNILEDIKKKDGKLEYGVYDLEIRIDGEKKGVKAIYMPEYTGILNDDDDLIYVFNSFEEEYDEEFDVVPDLEDHDEIPSLEEELKEASIQ